ncbi:MAG: hypothetical protein ABFD20_04880 [Anaerolineales bacterium]
MIRNARATADQVLVLDAGHGLLSTSGHPETPPGEIAAELYDLLGYDAVVLGAQDLATLGPEGVARIRASSRFALLSANAYPAGSDELAAEPYALRDMGSHKVAILGLTDSGDVAGWQIRDPLHTARRYVRQLRHEADIVILLSHAGQEVDRQIAERVRGIDVIVVGGNQRDAGPEIVGRDGTLLIHADQYVAERAGRFVGVAQLSLDGAGRLVRYAWQRIALDATVPADPAIDAWLLGLATREATPQ